MAYHSHVGACSDGCRTLAVTIARQLGFSLGRGKSESARLAALSFRNGARELARHIEGP